jgi:hypothetical protein
MEGAFEQFPPARPLAGTRCHLQSQCVLSRSQHLQALRQAALVDSRKQGLFVSYRLAGPEVFELTKVLRTVAEGRLAEFERLVREHFGDRADAEAVPMAELLKRARSKQVVKARGDDRHRRRSVVGLRCGGFWRGGALGSV